MAQFKLKQALIDGCGTDSKKLLSNINKVRNGAFSIKKIKKLGISKKFRDEENLIVLDGIHLTEEWIKQYSISNIQHIIIGREFLEHSEYEKFKDLENQIVLPDDLFAKISPTKTPSGILTVALKPDAPSLPLSSSAPTKALILDHLQDPGNIGTILRTAVAAGCDAVYLYECADIWSPKSLRAGQGAQFYKQLQIIEAKTPEGIKENFDGTIYGLSLEDKSQNFFEAKRSDSHAFALGNEGQGLCKEIQELCDEFLYIPMQNNFSQKIQKALISDCLV